MHKKCIIEDTTVTLCEMDTSKMYSMQKKCLIEDTTVTLSLMARFAVIVLSSTPMDSNIDYAWLLGYTLLAARTQVVLMILYA